MTHLWKKHYNKTLVDKTRFFTLTDKTRLQRNYDNEALVYKAKLL